jgi:hypothetical protein
MVDAKRHVLISGAGKQEVPTKGSLFFMAGNSAWITEGASG